MTIETYCKEICKGHFEEKSKILSALSEYEAKIRLKTIEEMENQLIVKGLGRCGGKVFRSEIEQIAEQMKGDKE